MPAEILEVDVRSGDLPSVRVTFMFGDNEPREYKECFAWYVDGLVYIKHYKDHPNMIPRAVFTVDHVFVEHFGPHPHPPQQRRPRPAQQRPPQPAGAPTGSVTPFPIKETSAVLLGGPEAAQQLREGKDPEKTIDEAWEKFERDAPLPQVPVEDPKEEPESSTEENSGSDPSMTETPSGKFRTSPLPDLTDLETLAGDQQKLQEDSQRLGLIPTSKSSRGGRKKHGSHGRPRPMPGATAFIALAMFLALSFRHTS